MQSAPQQISSRADILHMREQLQFNAAPHDKACAPPETLPRRYLLLRGNVYCFKRKIPADVPNAFKGMQGVVWRSLKTDSLQEALRRLPAAVEWFDTVVAQARKVPPQGRAPIKKRNRAVGTTKYLQEAHIPAIVARFEYFHLATDIELRRALVDDADFDARLEEFERGLELMRRDAARENYSHVQEVAETLLTEEHLIAPPGSAVHELLLRELMRVDIQTLQKQRDALRGERFDLPKTEPIAPRELPTLQTAFEAWRKSQTKARTIDAFEHYVRQFEAKHRELPMAGITPALAQDFSDHLYSSGLARTSVMNSVGGLATIWDSYTGPCIGSPNPFRTVSFDELARSAPADDRRAFEIHELRTLFTSPVYLGVMQPTGQVKESGYWVPLLGPFTGARLEELAQLRVADIQCINGVWCLRITDLEHDQSKKTSSSWRLVPLHAELIRCGFLTYVAQQKLNGHQHVFPSQSNQNKYELWSNALGKWFGRYLDRIGLDDPRLDFHSMRATFKQRCALCGIEFEVRDALTGHWISKDPVRAYMNAGERQYQLMALANAIEKLRYDELDLRHLYVAKPYDHVNEAWPEALGRR